jgi:serine/threonine protein kinase
MTQITTIKLCEFGWDNVSIPSNLSTICKYLPKWHQIKILREPQVHGRHFIYFPHHYFYTNADEAYMPALEKGELHNDNGGYSQIFKAQRSIYKPEGDLSGNVRMIRSSPFEEICIKEIVLHVDSDADEKEYIDEINAIMYEAYLHALLNITLDEAHLSGFVPRLYEVVALSTSDDPITSPKEMEAIWMTMEFMNGCTLEKFLRKKFQDGTMYSNTLLLKEIVLQLAHVLHHLQSKLLFNHRDLKINNVYVRDHIEHWSRKLDISGYGILECTTDLVMIDFGFGCIACGSGFVNPRATLLGAGSYFRPDDDCLKRGRDLAQFLYSLHCALPLENYVSRPMFDAIHSSMRAEKRGVLLSRYYDLFMGLDALGNPLTSTKLPSSIKYNDGIYIFLRDNTVDVPGCEPSRLIATLREVAL